MRSSMRPVPLMTSSRRSRICAAVQLREEAEAAEVDAEDGCAALDDATGASEDAAVAAEADDEIAVRKLVCGAGLVIEGNGDAAGFDGIDELVSEVARAFVQRVEGDADVARWRGGQVSHSPSILSIASRSRNEFVWCCASGIASPKAMKCVPAAVAQVRSVGASPM